MEGPFTFDTLSAQESLEKKSRSLTKIEPSFFRYVANYLDSLEREARKEQEKNPSSKRAAFLLDELRNGSNKAEELWKAREKKIVAFAQVNARKDPALPPEHLTREESEFYHHLVTLFHGQWQRLLANRTTSSIISTPVPAPVSRPTTAPAPPAQPAQAAQAAAGPVAADGKDEVQTIRALVDIPPFVGFDGKTYRIKKGEVLALPKKFASILKDRNQASIVG